MLNIDNIYIFDKDDNLLEIINNNNIANYKLIKAPGAESTFTFTLNNKDNLIKKYNKAGFVENDELQLFVIDNVDEYNSLNENTMTATCIDDITTLGNKIIEDKRVVNGKADVALSKALENTNYEVGIVEGFNNKDINFYFISSLTALNNILETYSCEFKTRIIIDAAGKIAHKYVDLVHRLGQDTGLRFTYDVNLNYIERTIADDSHFNVLYGRGKSLETDDGGYSRKLTFNDVSWHTPTHPVNKPFNQKYIEDAESIAKYGRLEGIYENDNIEDAEILLQATYDKLQDVKDIKYSYSISVEDLKGFDGFEHYDYSFGDTIAIIDEDENIVVEARIIKIADEVDLEENTEDTILTLGNFRSGFVETDNIDDVISSIKDKIENVTSDVSDNDFPNTLPDVPVLSGQSFFANISLNWTYENKIYYSYELYASKIKDFNPDSTNKIFEGKASSFTHETKCDETWYYRVRAKNSHGVYTKYSSQLQVSTFKIDDGTEFFKSAAIQDALIGTLKLDRAWVGQLTGNLIEAKNLKVIDGNNNTTLYIDSFGRVYIDATDLKINSKSISQTINSLTEFQQNSEGFIFKVAKKGINNLVKNSSFENAQGVITAKSGDVENVLITKQANEIVCNDNFLYIQGNGIPGDVYVETSLHFLAEPGETYTISADTRFATVGAFASSSSYIKMGNDHFHIFGNDNFTYQWHRVSTTWICPDNIGGIAYIRLGFRCADYSWGCYNNIKVEKGEVATPWCTADNEINEGVTSIDENGVTVSHNSGASASFYYDGSVWRDKNGKEILRINGQGLEYIDGSSGEWTGFIKSSNRNGDVYNNGITFSTSGLGDYLGFGCSKVTDNNSSWSTSHGLTFENNEINGRLSGMHFWNMSTNSSNTTHIHNHTNYIQENGAIYMNGQPIFFDSYGHAYPNWIGKTNNDRLGIFGDNNVVIGTRHGTTNRSAILISEGSDYDYIQSWCPWDMHGYTLSNARVLYSVANLQNKAYTEDTVLKSYDCSTRYIYEDMQIKNNKLILSIPNVYKGCEYAICSIAKKGRGDVWISEEFENYFIIEAENDIKVNIEIDIKDKVKAVMAINGQCAKDIEEIILDNIEPVSCEISE